MPRPAPRTCVHSGRHVRPRWTHLALAAALALVLPAAGLARGGGDVRVSGSCGRGASAELRLKDEGATIEVELRVRRGPDGERWSVSLVHERRVAWRGAKTTRGSGLRVRRDVADYAGADEIAARASGPRGLTCQASATLPG